MFLIVTEVDKWLDFPQHLGEWGAPEQGAGKNNP